MRVVVITGSPHKRGTSALLADEFIRGAEEAGHRVYRFDTAFECVHPCIGCETCECGKKPCVFKDGMMPLYDELKKADMVVFVSPVYYHALSAQIKMAIDRFHGIEIDLQHHSKKAMLILTAAAAAPSVADGAILSHKRTLKHLKWSDDGQLLALGCNTRSDIEKTDYPEQAHKMGRNLEE